MYKILRLMTFCALIGTAVSSSAEYFNHQKVTIDESGWVEQKIYLKQWDMADFVNKEEIDIEVHASNDNFLWGASKHLDAGDDFGYTHGIKVALGKDFSGHYVSVKYSSDLYSEQTISPYFINKQGELRYRQRITEENLLEISIDTKNKNEFLFFRVGLGAQYLRKSGRGGFLSASGQQKSFHEMVNQRIEEGRVFVPQNIGKEPNEWGGFARGGVGFQKDIYSTDSTHFRVQGETGGFMTSVNNASRIEAKFMAEFSHKASSGIKRKAQLEFGHEQYEDSDSQRVSLDLSREKGNRTLGIRMTKTLKGREYLKFDDADGYATTFYVKQKFGGHR